MRRAQVIFHPADEVVADLTASVQRPISEHILMYTLATKQLSRGLVLVSNRERVIEPVRFVRVPEQSPVKLDIDVPKSCGICDRFDMTYSMFEYYHSTIITIVMSTHRCKASDCDAGAEMSIPEMALHRHYPAYLLEFYSCQCFQT